MSVRKWIKGAIKRPGALRSTLQGLGLVKPTQARIPMKVLREAARGDYGPQTARRARAAITFRSFRKGKRKS